MGFRTNSRGFTLIEIVAAIALFTIGALAAARMQTTSLRGATFGKEALTATTAAQNLMEQLKDPGLTPFTTVLAGGGPGPVYDRMTTTTVHDNTGVAAIPGMTIQWTTANTQGALGKRYTTVTVNVKWAGNTRNYSTATVISEIP